MAILPFETRGFGGLNGNLAHLGDVPAAVGRYVDLARYGKGRWVSRSRWCLRGKAWRVRRLEEAGSAVLDEAARRDGLGNLGP